MDRLAESCRNPPANTGGSQVLQLCGAAGQIPFAVRLDAGVKETMLHDPPPPYGFPTTRLRRLRYHPQLRELVRETRLSAGNFVLPLFVRAGQGAPRPIDSMPGHFQWPVEQLEGPIRAAVVARLGGVLLFGIPAEKDSLASDSYSDAGIVQQAVREIKRIAPELLVVTDVCCCEYTDHGHCGVLDDAVRLAARMSITTPRWSF